MNTLKNHVYENQVTVKKSKITFVLNNVCLEFHKLVNRFVTKPLFVQGILDAYRKVKLSLALFLIFLKKTLVILLSGL